MNAEPPSRADRELLATPSRQSPLAFVFIAWAFVRRLGLSLVAAAVLFVANGGLAAGTLVLAAIGSVALLVLSALSWWRMTFCIVDDELVVVRGIASVERLVIPLARVQSVSLDQQLAHRPFGLVRVSVDTAGSTDVEFEIDAVDRPRAEALRRVATDSRLTASTGNDIGVEARPPPPADEILVRRSPGDLVRIGLTKFPWTGLVVFAPLIAIIGELGAIEDVAGQAGEFADDAVATGSGSVLGAFVVVGGILVAATLLGAAFQVGREIVTNWDLTLTRTPGGLRRTAGLLNTTSRSSTARRVQIITTDDSAPHRRLGFTKLTLHTFGNGNLELPGTTLAEVDLLRRLVVGDAPRPPLDRTISRWSVFVAARGAGLVALAITAVCWLAVGWWSLLAIAVVPVHAVAADRRWRRRRWGLDDDGAAESYGLIWRHAGEVALHKAQLVTVRQSFFERRRGLATVRIVTAGGSIGVPFVPLDEACDVRDRVLRRAETDRRPVL